MLQKKQALKVAIAINSFTKKYKYWLIGSLGSIFIVALALWYNQKLPVSEQETIELNVIDTLDNDTMYILEEVEIDSLSEEQDEIISKSSELKPKDVKNAKDITIRSGSNEMGIIDIRNIIRILNPKSISAKTIIGEISRLVSEKNNSMVSGAIIAESLTDKLSESTKKKLIENVEYVRIANHVISVKLKNAASLKLSFETKKKKKIKLKIYDNATININKNSSQVEADIIGFRYKYLGIYWKVKHLDIQEKEQKGTLDVQLSSKLKDINLPTITLGNLHRRIK